MAYGTTENPDNLEVRALPNGQQFLVDSSGNFAGLYAGAPPAASAAPAAVVNPGYDASRDLNNDGAITPAEQAATPAAAVDSTPAAAVDTSTPAAVVDSTPAAASSAPAATTDDIRSAVSDIDSSLGKGTRYKNKTSELTGVRYGGDKPAFEYDLGEEYDNIVAVKQGGSLKFYKDGERLDRDQVSDSLGVVISGESGNDKLGSLGSQLKDQKTQEVLNTFDSGLVSDYLGEETATANRLKKKDKDAFYGKGADSTGKITSGKNKGKFSQSYLDQQKRLATKTGDGFQADLAAAGQDIGEAFNFISNASFEDLFENPNNVDLTDPKNLGVLGSPPQTTISASDITDMSTPGAYTDVGTIPDELQFPEMDSTNPFGPSGITATDIGKAVDPSADEFSGSGIRREYFDDDEGFDSATYNTSGVDPSTIDLSGLPATIGQGGGLGYSFTDMDGNVQIAQPDGTSTNVGGGSPFLTNRDNLDLSASGMALDPTDGTLFGRGLDKFGTNLLQSAASLANITGFNNARDYIQGLADQSATGTAFVTDNVLSDSAKDRVGRDVLTDVNEDGLAYRFPNEGGPRGQATYDPPGFNIPFLDKNVDLSALGAKMEDSAASILGPVLTAPVSLPLSIGLGFRGAFGDATGDVKAKINEAFEAGDLQKTEQFQQALSLTTHPDYDNLSQEQKNAMALDIVKRSSDISNIPTGAIGSVQGILPFLKIPGSNKILNSLLGRSATTGFAEGFVEDQEVKSKDRAMESATGLGDAGFNYGTSDKDRQNEYLTAAGIGALTGPFFGGGTNVSTTDRTNVGGTPKVKNQGVTSISTANTGTTPVDTSLTGVNEFAMFTDNTGNPYVGGIPAAGTYASQDAATGANIMSATAGDVAQAPPTLATATGDPRVTIPVSTNTGSTPDMIVGEQLITNIINNSPMDASGTRDISPDSFQKIRQIGMETGMTMETLNQITSNLGVNMSPTTIPSGGPGMFEVGDNTSVDTTVEGPLIGRDNLVVNPANNQGGIGSLSTETMTGGTTNTDVNNAALSNANTNVDPNANTNVDPNANTNVDPNTNVNVDSNTNINAPVTVEDEDPLEEEVVVVGEEVTPEEEEVVVVEEEEEVTPEEEVVTPTGPIVPPVTSTDSETGEKTYKCPDGYKLTKGADGMQCFRTSSSTRMRAGIGTRAYTRLVGQNRANPSRGSRQATRTRTRRESAPVIVS